MRSFEQRLVALASAALFAAWSPSILASGAEEDAKSFFAQGRELRTSGRCADAVIAFRRAIEIYPDGLGALRNIAECEEELGLYASARRDWWDLRRAALQSNEARYAGWNDDAEARYRALADKVCTLTIKLRGATDRAAVRVLINGKPLDPRLVDVALERDPGAHTIEAAYGGAAPVARKVALSPGAREEVVLDLPTAPVADKGAGAGAASPSTSAMRTAGFVGLAVGGASAIATAVVIGVRAGALSDVEDGCARAGSGYSCPPDLQGAYDTGKTTSLLANVFAGAAIVGLGAGVTLLVLDKQRPTAASAPPAAVSLTLRGTEPRLLVRF